MDSVRDYVEWHLTHSQKIGITQGVPLIMNNCKAGEKMKELEIYGNTLYGKNYYDYTTAAYGNFNTYRCELSYEDGVFIVKGNTDYSEWQPSYVNGHLGLRSKKIWNIKQGTYYTLSFYITLLELEKKYGFSNKPIFGIYCGDRDDYTKYSDISDKLNVGERTLCRFTFKPSSDIYDRLAFRLYGHRWKIEINTLQIEKGHTATEFEAFSSSSVGVMSRNLIDYQTFVARSGNTLIKNDDGSMDYIGNYYISAPANFLQSGNSYSLTLDYESDEKVSPCWRIKYSDNTYSSIYPFSASINIDSTKSVDSILIYVSMSDVTYRCRFKNIMLVRDGDDTEYEPYGKQKIPVIIRGRNLLNYKTARIRDNYTKGSITFNNDGSLTYVGNYYFRYDISLESGKTYVFSAEYENTSGNSPAWYLWYSDGTRYGNGFGRPITVPADKTVVALYIYTVIGTAGNYDDTLTLRNIQLEEGSTATEYLQPSIENVFIDTPLDEGDVISFMSGKVTRNNGNEESIVCEMPTLPAKKSIIEVDSVIKPLNIKGKYLKK